jgi:glycosyltransferase involved in cell wall biosynthesis
MNKIIFLNSCLILSGIGKKQLEYVNFLEQNNYNYEVVIVDNLGEENVLEKYFPKPVIYLKSYEYICQQRKIREERNQNLIKKIKFNFSLEKSYKHIVKNFDKIYREFQPSVIIDYDNCLRGNIDDYNCKNNFNCKTIGWTHTYIQFWLKNINSAKRYAKALNRYSEIIAVSEECVEELIKLNPKLDGKVHCIYNPFDFETIKNLANEEFSAEEKEFAEKKFLLMVARLEMQQKDFETLIKAFDLAKKSGYSGELYLIGDGIHKNLVLELKEKSEFRKNIHLLGSKINPYNWMKNCDKFILSTKYEGLGNVLVEALAVNDLVISSNCKSGPKEILEDGKIGYLFEVGDYKNLSELILHSKAKDRNLIDESLQRFDKENIMKKFREIFKRKI